MILMAKYSKFKYGKGKYGVYDIEIPSGIDLSQTTQFRLRTISSRIRSSRPIVNQVAKITGLGGPVKLRLRTNDGHFVYTESVEIEGGPRPLRLKMITSKGESPWIESVIGTIRKKG
jgi:hypothetical protein